LDDVKCDGIVELWDVNFTGMFDGRIDYFEEFCEGFVVENVPDLKYKMMGG